MSKYHDTAALPFVDYFSWGWKSPQYEWHFQIRGPLFNIDKMKIRLGWAKPKPFMGRTVAYNSPGQQ